MILDNIHNYNFEKNHPNSPYAEDIEDVGWDDEQDYYEQREAFSSYLRTHDYLRRI